MCSSLLRWSLPDLWVNALAPHSFRLETLSLIMLCIPLLKLTHLEPSLQQLVPFGAQALLSPRRHAARMIDSRLAHPVASVVSTSWLQHHFFPPWAPSGSHLSGPRGVVHIMLCSEAFWYMFHNRSSQSCLYFSFSSLRPTISPFKFVTSFFRFPISFSSLFFSIIHLWGWQLAWEAMLDSIPSNCHCCWKAELWSP